VDPALAYREYCFTDREYIYGSVADPNPDPLVFGPPGSGPDPLARGMDQDPSTIK
jgi:hypothetical protein